MATTQLQCAWEGEAVVFLDCDGVLCLSRSLGYDVDEHDPSLFFDPKDQCLPLEKACLANLKLVVDEGKALGVVLTTTWREQADMRAFLATALASHGIELVGDTPQLASAGRGAEIQAWLLAHPHIRRHVALEDAPRHIANFGQHGVRYVQTLLTFGSANHVPALEGLTLDKARAAVAVLLTGRMPDPAPTC